MSHSALRKSSSSCYAHCMIYKRKSNPIHASHLHLSVLLLPRERNSSLIYFRVEIRNSAPFLLFGPGSPTSMYFGWASSFSASFYPYYAVAPSCLANSLTGGEEEEEETGQAGFDSEKPTAPQGCQICKYQASDF